MGRFKRWKWHSAHLLKLIHFLFFHLASQAITATLAWSSCFMIFINLFERCVTEEVISALQ